jgi:predicted N-acyltransferase
MSNYSFIENGFAGSDTFTLFQNPAFFNLHARAGASYFELCHKGQTKATIHFTPVNGENTWRSPAKGTFAGLSFVEDLKLNEVFSFLKSVELSLISKGAKELEVLPAPQAHDVIAFSKQVYLLRSCGFETTRCDLNQSLEIDERSLSDRMSYGNLKRLRKCKRDGLIATQLPLSHLPLVYETLEINRAYKGNSLSMTLAQLQQMIDVFPEDVVLFGCPHGEHLASAALCLRISSAVLYVFYWGDRPEYATHSPVVAVADAIYEYAQEQDFKVMDVGTSTVDREPNFGLLEFKSGLGFSESLKLIMRKTL